MRTRHLQIFLLPIAIGIISLFCSTCIPSHFAAAQDAHNHVHPTDPGKAREHMAMLDLVNAEFATETAVKDGKWSDPAIWSSGKVPAANAKVHIPADITVTYDVNSQVEIRWLGVDGIFRFDPTLTTLLKIDTIVITPEGTLEQGTPKNPINESVTSTVQFTDYGPIDRDYDPLLLSRGLIAHGATVIQGATRTRYLPLASNALKGTTQIQLLSEPEGWRVGDEVLLTSTARAHYDDIKNWPYQNEAARITEIQGKTIVFDKILKYDHISPGFDHNNHLSLYLVNFTNNIKYESVNHDMSDEMVKRHGHVMFMHSEKVSVSYAEFDYLGRTNKKYDIDDVFPEFKSLSEMTAGTGTNVRGRYALHVHRTGRDTNSTPTLINGVSVRYSPGWGIVNHESYVNVMNSAVAYIHGSGFVEESGNGLGAFRDNIAVEIYHSGKNAEHRENHILNDVCFHGAGFCFRGNTVKSENCIAVDTEAGFSWLNKFGEGHPSTPATSLPHPGFANNAAALEMLSVPTTTFHNSTVINSINAVDSGYWYVFAVAHGGRNHIENFRAYNVNRALEGNYTTNLTLRNFHATASPDDVYGAVGVNFNNNVAGDTVLDDVALSGYSIGIHYGPDIKMYILGNCDFSNTTTPFRDVSSGTGQIINVPVSDLQYGRFSFTPDTPVEINDSAVRYTGIINTATITDTLGSKTIIKSGIEQGMFNTTADVVRQMVAHGIYGSESNGYYLVFKHAFMDRILGTIHPVNFKVSINTDFVKRLRTSPNDFPIGPDLGEFVSELGTPVVRVNAGGSATSGFSGDTGFTGSSTAVVVAGNDFDLKQWNSAPQAIYTSARQGNNFIYKLTGLSAGTKYVVRLHFIENLYSQPAKRIFNISINDAEALPRFDILADAGKLLRSVVKDIDAVADSSGGITVGLQATADSPDQNALISGIEVLTDFGINQAPPASLSPRPGVYTSEQYVMLTSDISSVKIRYTTDGSTPTLSSQLYTAPFLVDKTSTVQSIVEAPGLRPSTMAGGTYTIVRPSDTIRYNLGGGQVGNFAPDTISLSQVGPFGSASQTPYFLETSAAIDTSATNAGPAAIYQTSVEQRWYGSFPEIIQNLYPNIKYTLRLHFSESASENNFIGARLFDIFVNGIPVRKNFDIVAQAGGQINKAAIIDIADVQSDRLGQIYIAFLNTDPGSDPSHKQRDGAAIVNALELIPPKLVSPVSPQNLRLRTDK